MNGDANRMATELAFQVLLPRHEPLPQIDFVPTQSLGFCQFFFARQPLFLFFLLCTRRALHQHLLSVDGLYFGHDDSCCDVSSKTHRSRRRGNTDSPFDFQ